jgi:endo-1,4-beta-xylanase
MTPYTRSWGIALFIFADIFAGTAKGQAPMWLDPDKSEPIGTHYRTFTSKLAGSEVSYLVYLPPDYETNAARRYPVVYWLPGYSANMRAGATFVKPLDGFIRDGKAPSMIVILVNGIKASYYRDDPSGKRPVESVIMKELIPHVDQTYRTIASRESRAVEGFSMGGYGAGHLGFKYPEVFGLVVVGSGAMNSWAGKDSKPPSNEKTPGLSAGSKAFLEANHPCTLVKKNADVIRGKTAIRIVVGDQDGLLPYNAALHDLLTKLKIEHEYLLVPGVGHNSGLIYSTVGERTFAWYLKAWSGKLR